MLVQKNKRDFIARASFRPTLSARNEIVGRGKGTQRERVNSMTDVRSPQHPPSRTCSILAPKTSVCVGQCACVPAVRRTGCWCRTPVLPAWAHSGAGSVTCIMGPLACSPHAPDRSSIPARRNGARRRRPTVSHGRMSEVRGQACRAVSGVPSLFDYHSVSLHHDASLRATTLVFDQGRRLWYNTISAHA